jgi:hypothetical protein
MLFVIGGNGPGLLNSVEAYDPQSNTWMERAPLPVPLGNSPGMAATFNGRIYVCGGSLPNGQRSNAVYVYDPASDSWSFVTPMPIARENLATASVNAELYAIGGYAGNPTITAEVDAFTANCEPPLAQSAFSRKTHGGAGTFDIDLPFTGTSGVECRSGGATNDFTVVVTFASNVAVTGSPQAQVTSGTGTIGSAGVSNGGMVNVSANTVTIPLTNVADQQTINVTLNGVTSASIDQPATNFVIPMSRLLGDTNGNRAVNASDVSQTKSRIGQAVTSANFRSDVNANGTINAGDVSLVKANGGHAVP